MEHKVFPKVEINEVELYNTAFILQSALGDDEDVASAYDENGNFKCICSLCPVARPSCFDIDESDIEEPNVTRREMLQWRFDSFKHNLRIKFKGILYDLRHISYLQSKLKHRRNMRKYEPSYLKRKYR